MRAHKIDLIQSNTMVWHAVCACGWRSQPSGVQHFAAVDGDLHLGIAAAQPDQFVDVADMPDRSNNGWPTVPRRKRGRTGGFHAERNALIRQRRIDGEKLGDIAKDYGLTREAIRLICKGIAKPDLNNAPRCRTCGAKLSYKSKTGYCREHLPEGWNAGPNRNGWGPERVKDAIERFYVETGYFPTAVDLNPAMARAQQKKARSKAAYDRLQVRIDRFAEGWLPYMTTVNKYFGNLNGLRVAMGLEPRPSGNRYWASTLAGDPTTPLPPPDATKYCRHGHAMTPDNTYLTKRGQRVCATCQRIHSKESYHRRHPDAKYRKPYGPRKKETTA